MLKAVAVANPSAAEQLARRIKDCRARAKAQGRSYDAVLADDVRAGDRRVLAEARRRRNRSTRHLVALYRRDHPKLVTPLSTSARDTDRSVSAARPREHRAHRRRGPPREPDDPAEPVDDWRGFVAASVRMVQHLERRRAKQVVA